MYEALKCVHVGCVIASGTGFVARGAPMLVDSPLTHPWLAAKIVALLA